MIYVTMRDGRTIRYNDANRYVVEDGMVHLRQKSCEKQYGIAMFPLMLIERVEFAKPCAIHDKDGKSIKVEY